MAKDKLPRPADVDVSDLDDVVDLEEVGAPPRTIRVKLNDTQAMTVTYRPGAITPAVIAQFAAVNAAAASDDTADQLDVLTRFATAFLPVALVEWPLRRGGQPVPITREALADVRADVLIAVTFGVLAPKGA